MKWSDRRQQNTLLQTLSHDLNPIFNWRKTPALSHWIQAIISQSLVIYIECQMNTSQHVSASFYLYWMSVLSISRIQREELDSICFLTVPSCADEIENVAVDWCKLDVEGVFIIVVSTAVATNSWKMHTLCMGLADYCTDNAMVQN